MAQHRIMTILLFMCFQFAQSQFQTCEAPCVNSVQCRSGCCQRDSPARSGECGAPQHPGDRCYGPNPGQGCFYSNECNSGCCSTFRYVATAVCAVKNPTRRCFGPNNGDYCFSSDRCNSRCCARRFNPLTPAECTPREATQECYGSNDGQFCAVNEYCKSGCCRRENAALYSNRGRCTPLGAENATCFLAPRDGLYNDCPCASGLTCVPRSFESLGGTCRKPSTANN